MSSAVTLAILPKVSAILSICGSTAILTECVYYDRSRLKLVHHRILCLMAIFDLLESPWYFASTWALPSSSGVKYAIGNDATCKAQGFFLQLGVASIALNACLSWYYLLVIRYSWSEERIKEKAAPWMYGTPIILGFGVAFAGFPLKLYTVNGDWCWLSDDDNDKLYQNLLFYGPLLFFTMAAVINTALLIWTVWKLESATRKYLGSSYAKSVHKKNQNSSSNKLIFPKRLEGKPKETTKRNKCDLDTNTSAAKRKAELDRKLEEVRSKSPQRSIGESSHTTCSILQLRVKNNEIKALKSQPQDVGELASITSMNFGGLEEGSNIVLEQEQERSKKIGIFNKSFLNFKDVARVSISLLTSFKGSITFNQEERKARSKTRIVAEQSLYYLLAFFLTYGWSIVFFIFQDNKSYPNWLRYGHYTFDPMQGFLNYMVYIRPKFLSHRKKYPFLTRLQCLLSLIAHREMAREGSNYIIENEAKTEIKKLKEVTFKDNATMGETFSTGGTATTFRLKDSSLTMWTAMTTKGEPRLSILNESSAQEERKSQQLMEPVDFPGARISMEMDQV